MRRTVISFSGRKDGNCAGVAREIQKRYGAENVKIYDFSSLSIAPCGGCGAQCFQKEGACPHRNDPVCEMYESITQSDLAVYIVPNYCDFPSSHFFAFSERGQCYFQRNAARLEQYERAAKKFIVVSNTKKENFIAAFSDHVHGEPEILFLAAKHYGRISLKGDLMTSDEAKRDVLRFLE
ncbi:MAG: NAD(P)H-dependent oxidoreductase [Eubacteriales bacterium]|nr:NAD(P)H-dependent oxidoreductase [Eubacteriales bacterium]